MKRRNFLKSVIPTPMLLGFSCSGEIKEQCHAPDYMKPVTFPTNKQIRKAIKDFGNMPERRLIPIPTFDKRLYESMPDRFIKANPKIY